MEFVDDVVGGDHPADEDGGQQGDEGHHHAIADVVHQIQQLAYGAVGQGDIQIEQAVAQGDNPGVPR